MLDKIKYNLNNKIFDLSEIISNYSKKPVFQSISKFTKKNKSRLLVGLLGITFAISVAKGYIKPVESDEYLRSYFSDEIKSGAFYVPGDPEFNVAASLYVNQNDLSSVSWKASKLFGIEKIVLNYDSTFTDSNNDGKFGRYGDIAFFEKKF